MHVHHALHHALHCALRRDALTHTTGVLLTYLLAYYVQGLNTGVFLLRKCEWSRQLMAEVAALATPSIRRQIGNKGRIAEQGALTWVLHSQASKWKDRTLLERNFTMNGN